MKKMAKIVLLPGASGQTTFWQPLIDLLPSKYEKQIIAYPGFGNVLKNDDLKNFDDLQELVIHQINQKSILIAQSMGGIFAVKKTLERPDLIQGLVLIATSGGINLTPFNVQDWRTEYQQYYPQYPDWFMTNQVDYEEFLAQINVPILLIWGDCDPISPISVGQYLHSKLKNATLYIIEGGKHDLAEKHADQVSAHINQFLEHLV